MSLFTHTNYSSRRRPQDSFMHRIANDPFLDWFIMVICAVVISGIVIGAGFIAYHDAEARLSAPVISNAMSPQRLLDREAMSRILQTFKARTDEHAALIKAYSGVADPSL